ncbi:MAG: DUF2807 domain-containing protein, partial [Alphaproteobacteria bacterium]
NACTGYNHTKCPTGYTQSATCQSGKTKKLKCENCASGYVKYNGQCYKQLKCKNGGKQTGNSCSCPSGWTGTLCETKNTCPYNTTSCGNGYYETGETCTSGTIKYKECKPNNCEGYQTNCGSGYYKTSDTCLSGTTQKYKCAENACTGYNYTKCPTGYTQSATCQSGSTLKLKCDNCADGYHKENGACIPIKDCHHGYQQGNDCVCANGWTGSDCNTKNTCTGYNKTCSGDYHASSSDICYEGNEILYKCIKNTCEGFNYTECPAGYVQSDSCQINGNIKLKCENCAEGFIKYGAECIREISCQNGGIQEGSECRCQDGWSGQYCQTVNECPYSTTSCDEGYEETGQTCVSGGTLYKECRPKTCPYNTTSCDDGYTMTGNTCKSGKTTYVECIKDTMCSTYPLSSVPSNCQKISQCTTQNGTLKYRCDKCNATYGRNGNGVCVKQSSNPKILVQSNINNSKKSLTNTDYANVYGMSGISENKYNASSAQGAELKIVNKSDGNLYGIYADYGRNAYTPQSSASGLINLENYGLGKIYGIYGISGIANAQTDAGYAEADINIKGRDSGTIYGMYTELTEFSESQVVSDVLTKNADSKSGQSVASLTINNIGDSLIYGMNAGATGINASSSTGTASASINITNIGNKNIYGMYAEYLTQNVTSNRAEASGEIIIKNIGNGSIFGLYSNGYAHNVASYSEAETYGLISINNRGDGEITVMTSADTRTSDAFNRNIYYFQDVASYHLYNARANNAESTANINVYDEGEGNITIFNTILDNEQTFSQYDGNITYNTYAFNNGTAHSNIKIKNASSDDDEKVITLSRETLNLAYAEKNGTAENNIVINNDGKSRISLSESSHDYYARISANKNSTVNNNIKIVNRGDSTINMPIKVTATEKSIVNNALEIDNTGASNINVYFNVTASGNKTIDNSVVIKNEGNTGMYINTNVGNASTQTKNKINIEDNGSGDIYITAVNQNALYNKQKTESELSIKKCCGKIELTDSSWGAYADNGGTANNKFTLDLSGTATIFRPTNSYLPYINLATASNSSNSNIGSTAINELNIIRTDYELSFSLVPFYLTSGYLSTVENTVNIQNINSSDIYLDLSKTGVGSAKNSVTVNNIGDNNINVKFILSGGTMTENTYNITNEGDGNITIEADIANVSVQNEGNGNITLSRDGGSANITTNGTGNVAISGASKDVVLNKTGNGDISVLGDDGKADITHEGNGGIEISGNLKNLTINKIGDGYNISNNEKSLIQLFGDTGSTDITANGNGNINIENNSKDLSLNQTGNGNIFVAGNDGTADITAEGSGMMTISGLKEFFIKNNGRDITDNSTGSVSKIIHYDTGNITSSNANSIIDYRGLGSVNIASSGWITNRNNGSINGEYISKIMNISDGHVYNAKNIINAANGLAVGLYTQADLTNSQDIMIHNLGNGTAVGIYVDGTAKLTNSGDITINRTQYTGQNLKDDGTVENVTYTASSATGGNAIGIYGAANSTISNTGTIRIDGAENAYGIFSEGGNVSNTGTIIIDGSINSINAVQLNRGQLFQDGVLKVGADFAHPGCAEGYIELEGICYVKLNCIANASQVKNECVCNKGYRLIDDVCQYVGTTDSVNDHDLVVTHTDNDSNVYGMYVATGYGYNAYNTTGSIKITNTKNGDVYGMYGTSDLFNGYGKSGKLAIYNEGIGNVYGIYSTVGTVRNGYENGTGLIRIIDKGNNNLYGMRGGYVSNETDTNNTSTLEITNLGDGLAIGLYASGADGTIHNTGDIIIHNLGNGTAIGLYADGNNAHISNSGNITIDRNGYYDNDFNKQYSPISSVGGKAIGIYGTAETYINNTSAGTITISGAEESYGIWSEGGNVTNNGTITIDGSTCTGGDCFAVKNAIQLNRGRLMQNGVLEVKTAFIPNVGCAEDSVLFGDFCYKRIDCGIGGEQYEDRCICHEGYTLANTSVCHTDLHCENNHATQTEDTCYCNNGYVMMDGVCNRVGYNGNSSYSNITIENNDDLNVYGIYENSKPNTAVKNFSAISISNNGNGNIYGMYGVSTGDQLYNSGTITLSNTGDGDIYGMHGTHWTFNSSNTTKGTITISNQGSGNIYGIADGNKRYNAYNAQISSINISNIGSANIYGIYGQYGDSYNAYNSQKSDSVGMMTIYNQGDGDIYGIYTGGLYGIAYNAYNNSYSGQANGKIIISNQGNGDIYGLYGKYVYNIIKDYGQATGRIDIVSRGIGNSYGLYGTSAYNLSTNYNQNSYIKMANVGDGLAVGIYAKDGTIENSGDITIHNLGNGIAVGIMADGATTVTNSGTITINRTSYTDDKGNTYSAETETGGKAIGIYGSANSTITNTGTITINGASTGYGIYAETGAKITNTGTIRIAGDSNSSDAIKLNRGTLFQDGKMIKNADFESCADGYIIQDDNICYPIRTCEHGHQYHNSCVCDEGYVLFSNQCYEKLDCGEHATQNGDTCRCKSGYLMIDGICQRVNKIVENNDDSDVYGMYGNNQNQYNVYNNTSSTTASGTINISNTGEGNIYGMYMSNDSEETYNIYNAYQYSGYSSTTTGTINIINIGDGNVYGMYSTSGAYNAYGTNSACTVTGIIDITNTGNGDVYGMYGDDKKGSVYNAWINGNGTINITNAGSGNVYGMYGYSIWNSSGGYSGYSSNGRISIINNGNENSNAYGMFGKNVHNVTQDTSQNSIIEMTNINDSLAVGIYENGIYGNSTKNSGDIIIHNLGNGTAVGIMADGSASVTNSGTITIDRESYTDDKGNTYSAETETGGTAIGIYGSANSSITNTGTITINGASKGYGIWSEGGDVNNTGTIIIAGNSNSANAIKLNRGTLFQDGKMIKDADFESCADGYVMQADGICY